MRDGRAQRGQKRSSPVDIVEDLFGLRIVIDFGIDSSLLSDHFWYQKLVRDLLKIDPRIDHDSKTAEVLHDIHGTRSLLAPLGATFAHKINPEAVQDRSSSDLESDIETKSFLRPIFA